jgi:hypothetical protein
MTVVLEVGAGVGALVLYAPAALDGWEIEISRDRETRRTHSRVRPRHVPGGTRYAAVYPGLPEGRYTIWRDEHRVCVVTVSGGRVTSCRWPSEREGQGDDRGHGGPGGSRGGLHGQAEPVAPGEVLGQHGRGPASGGRGEEARRGDPGRADEP